MIVKANTPLSDNEKRMIRDIRRESKCINESLKATFLDAFHHYDEESDTAYFGAHGPYITYEF